MLHKSYEVWITCEGERLPEYQAKPEGKDGKEIGCFIPSESGKSFAINWKDHAAKDDLVFGFDLDGSPLSHGKWCAAGGSGQKAGVITDANSEQAFLFADLKTSDDEALLSGTASLPDIGSIQVNVMRLVRGSTRQVPFIADKFSAIGAVHERSKKAGAHSVSLGKGASLGTHYQTLAAYTPLDPSEGYVATFNFRYRPLALLQAQDIAPLAKPEPKPPAAPQQNDNRALKRSGSFEDRLPKRARQEPSRDMGTIDLSDEEDVETLKVCAKRTLMTWAQHGTCISASCATSRRKSRERCRTRRRRQVRTK
ncbi:uncharacterized protein BXZ73DRAFT_41735 [Epithele typhae]|uniref:uncharacterized protein n=1 Tax=Epithele typhae TaxID=378194 RepID=UPI002007A8AD|nr:uncharacterized protein BXZ73DRAFT_41735 [Epithele typhae]KAH9941778.1 hypothetical protein BXZ73DRAFT_41735 [Epithele typhae]